MGRAKKKRVAKRRKRMFNRNSIRAKMGKPVFFTLTHCNKKMSGISNKYNYKAEDCMQGVTVLTIKKDGDFTLKQKLTRKFLDKKK